MQADHRRTWPWTELIIATRNSHKVRELNALCERELGLPVVGLDRFSDVPEVVEDGDTFEANAVKKAETISRALNRPVVADDSGLVVPSLGGAPGVRSARYAGPEADDRANNEKLLKALEGKAGEEREAYFVCVLALKIPGEEPRLVRGECRGRIAHEPKGDQGFGYDPLFFLPEYGKTMGEVPPELKNRISHRAMAFQGLLRLLKEIYRFEKPVSSEGGGSR